MRLEGDRSVGRIGNPPRGLQPEPTLLEMLGTVAKIRDVAAARFLGRVCGSTFCVKILAQFTP